MKDNTRYTCASCKKFDCCGWSNIEPKNLWKVSRKLAINEPCENYCEPTKIAAEDIQDEAATNLMLAMVLDAKNELEESLKIRRELKKEMSALEKSLILVNESIDNVKSFLPEKATDIIEKSVESHYKIVDSRHHGTAEDFIKKLEAQISQIGIEVSDLLVQRDKLFTDLTSCTTSFSPTPKGNQDPHAFDAYAELTAEIDAKCAKIIKLKKRIAKVKATHNIR